MKSDLLKRIPEVLEPQGLLRPDALLLVAVSGGPDSLCLLHLLWRLRSQKGRGPSLHIAHLDHTFRGEQSAAEARFVAHTAHAWNIPATVEQQDIPALVARTGENKQAAARRVRYAFLARVARTIGADALAVAHHADDQAETLLLHLLRGAGPAGLRGMRGTVAWEEWAAAETTETAGSARPPMVRPLLDTNRAEIEHYCTLHRLTPQHDPSNREPRYTRNRIRANLLPHMQSYNQSIVAALGRTARICSDDYAFIQQQLDHAWNTGLAEELEGAVRFAMSQWRQLPVSLQRYALRRAALALAGVDDLSFEQIEGARAMALRATGTEATIGAGLVLRVEYETILVFHTDTFTEQEEAHYPQLEQNELVLSVPGTTRIAPHWSLITSFTEPENVPDHPRWRCCITIDYLALDGPLVVRWRRPGDRFRPLGGAGSRRLQDFFVDQKVPQPQREHWPILTTPMQIVWVVGLRPDGRFCAMGTTRQPLWIVLSYSLLSFTRDSGTIA